jgi:hypothetical protein
VNAYERLISDSAVWVDEGWLPPREACEELADLKSEHLRLLAATHEALQMLGTAGRDAALVAEQRSETLTAAVLEGKDPMRVKLPDEPDTEAVERAKSIYLSTADALERFVKEVRRLIYDREPGIRDRIAEQLSEAAALREEAQKLLAQAEAMEADPERLVNWLDRYNGTSHLGPLAFERMPAPWIGPPPGGARLVLAEGQAVGVGGDFPTVEELNAQALARIEAEEQEAEDVGP